MKSRFASIGVELKHHAPFTLFGALTGILCMIIFRNLDHDTNEKVFYVFHPAHVLLSAMVTGAMFKLHSAKRSFIMIVFIAIIGSVGISTLSDSVIPYIGESLLGMEVSVHGHGHNGEDTDSHEAHGESGFVEKAHIGFIEGWYIVFPAAVFGALVAYFRPRTRIPHAGHVLLSTWASSFHMLMAFGGNIPPAKLAGSFGFLFLAVWLPCCISDIVLPLLFVHSPDGLCCCHGEHKEVEK
ncbi:MAG: hypothetical protein JW720_15615 [Sedimentisphaerales bacterium]|nr:hypothetical protein [Sedimentisphaerales bacterium]